MSRYPSGFDLNPVGYTGIICGGRNPRTGDCFWRCRILEVNDTLFRVEIEDGRQGWVPRKEFTPMAILWVTDPVSQPGRQASGCSSAATP